MAKKSAKSKGYRKTIKAKPFLTKKEIIELVVIVAVILLGILLFNIFYDDGFLGADEVQANDIVYYASSDLRDRYMKLGTANELEGFTMDTNDTTSSDGVILRRTYTPNEPIDSLDYINVSASYVNASSLAETNYAYLSSTDMISNIVLTDIKEETVQGYPAYVFSYQEDYYQAEETEDAAVEATEEEQPSNVFNQGISTFIQLDDEKTVCMYIYFAPEDASEFIAEDQIMEYVEKYSAAFTLAQPETK